MRTSLGVFAVFSLFILMVVPAYAVTAVTSLSLEKSFYTIDENFSFVGTLNGTETVVIIIRNANGNFKGMLSDPKAINEFDVIPKSVRDVFSSSGIYNATAFTDKQQETDGFVIQLEFDGSKMFEVPDTVLQLNTITDKITEVEKTITFTASITDSSIEGAVFSLLNNSTGATIDPNSGKFVWTPSKSYGNIHDVQHYFDIIVKQGSQEDKENFKITVKQAYVEPEKQSETVPTTQPKEPLGIATFVDKSKDPQSYVDRYNNEANYKEWFDKSYPEYDSIYQAVGLEKPLEVATFVDKSKDPQSYVDRYNNEANYKEWFDKSYPEYDSIYQAVGLEEPKESTEDKELVKESEFGECGVGTDLVDGMCVINNAKGGGCLIATAAYDSELVPQVQLLREIRDNQLMNTDYGTSFMAGFNQLYYSFSPTIADMQRENPVFKEVIKLGITPLLSSLSIMGHAESDSEVLGYGIGVILLNIGMYFAAPAIIIFKTRKYIRI